MYMAPDDAKTDVILVGAVYVFGRAVIRIVAGLPGYPASGVANQVLDLLWLLALTALVPVLLARHRGDGAAAFGLDGSPAALGPGLVLALPVAAAGMLPSVLVGGALDTVLLGRIGPALLPVAGPDPVIVVLTLARIAAMSGGVLLVVAFLANRGREGFPRSPDVPLTQLLRSVGLVAVAAATVLGLLNALRLQSGTMVIEVIVDVIAITVLLALVDRHVDAGLLVPRSTVLAPVIVVTVAHLIAAGGLFFGDLLGGLLTGALALGVTVAIAALAQTRSRAWVVLPMAVAAHWWVTPLSPIP